MSWIADFQNGSTRDGYDMSILYRWFLYQTGFAFDQKYPNTLKVVPSDPENLSIDILDGVILIPYQRDGAVRHVIASNTSRKTLAVNAPAAQDRYSTVIVEWDPELAADAEGTNVLTGRVLDGEEDAAPSILSDAEIDAIVGGQYWTRLADFFVEFGEATINAADIEQDTRVMALLNAQMASAPYGEVGAGYVDATGRFVRINSYVEQDVRFKVVLDEDGNQEIVHATVYPSSTYTDNINYALGLCGTVEITGDAGTQFAPEAINLRRVNGMTLYSKTPGIEIVDTNMTIASNGSDIAMIDLQERCTVNNITLRPTGVANRGMYANRNLGAVGSVTLNKINIFDVVNLEHGIISPGGNGAINGDWRVSDVRMIGGGQVQASTQFGFHMHGIVNSVFSNCFFAGNGGVGYFGTQTDNVTISGNFHNASNGDSVRLADGEAGGFVRRISISGTCDNINWSPSDVAIPNRSTKAGLVHN